MKKVAKTPWARQEEQEQELEQMKQAFKDGMLKDFLNGPDPRTMSVNSVGTCPFCKHHGAGPGHACRVWDEHNKTKR